MERWHIIQLIPARVPAGIVPHAVAAPAMIDRKFIDVIASVTDTFFVEYLLDKVDHVSRVVRPVIAAVDDEDIELLPIKSEFLCVFDFLKFSDRAGTLRAFFRGILPPEDESTDVAFPDITGKQAGRFLFPGCNKRHVKIPLFQAPGMPGRDIPFLPVCRCFYR
jgi:hypothetical protein